MVNCPRLSLPGAVRPSIGVGAPEPNCYSALSTWICKDYFVDPQDELIEATKDTCHHASLVLGLVRWPSTSRCLPPFLVGEGLVLGTSSIIYTIPSLALFAFSCHGLASRARPSSSASSSTR